MRSAVLLLAALASCASSSSSEDEPRSLTTIAIRVHRMNAMMDFYHEAFGAEFRAVETLGITSQFTELDDLTLKFVPIRESVDFENYPSHQLGFVVADVEHVIEVARKYGGIQEGSLVSENGRSHGACRDPDGNTIELYERAGS